MPTIIVESGPENYQTVEKILLDLGYIMLEKIATHDYLFTKKDL